MIRQRWTRILMVQGYARGFEIAGRVAGNHCDFVFYFLWSIFSLHSTVYISHSTFYLSLFILHIRISLLSSTSIPHSQCTFISFNHKFRTLEDLTCASNQLLPQHHRLPYKHTKKKEAQTINSQFPRIPVAPVAHPLASRHCAPRQRTHPRTHIRAKSNHPR